MLGPRDKTDLKSSSDFNSTWADRVAYLILIGLLVDIAALFVSEGWRKIAVATGANLLIFGGVWGELLFAKRAREADDGRVAQAETAVAEANERAAKLEKEAETTRARIAEAAALQAEAEARTKEAEVNLEKLRDVVARNAMQRTISVEPFLREMNETKPYRAQILYDSNANDGYFFAIFLTAALSQAGWQVSLPISLSSVLPDMSPMGMPEPFIVRGRSNGQGVAIIANRVARQDDAHDPLNALTQAIFKSEAENSVSKGVDDRLPEDTLKIIIGFKTSTWLGPFQLPASDVPANKP